MINLYRLELLVLARLSVATKSRPSRSDLSKVLYPFVQAVVEPAAWRADLDTVIVRLRGEGQVEQQALTLTDQGRSRLCEVLGTEEIPVTNNWAEFKKRHLRQLLTNGQAQPPAGATPARVFLADVWGVPIETSVSDPALANAYVMDRLGLTTMPLTLGELRGGLLARELGVPYEGDLGEVLRQGAAKIAAASTSKPDDIILAHVGHWVLEGEASDVVFESCLEEGAMERHHQQHRHEEIQGDASAADRQPPQQVEHPLGAPSRQEAVGESQGIASQSPQAERDAQSNGPSRANGVSGEHHPHSVGPLGPSEHG